MPFRGHLLEPQVQFDLHFSRVFRTSGFLWTAKGEQGERNREFHALFLVLLVEENQ